MRELDELLEQMVENKVVPGMNYGITGECDYIGSVGYKQLYPVKEKIEVDTLYDIASLSKVVVTLPLICKMVSEHKITFWDSVRKYLPKFKYDDVTVYHLLTHTSGLPADLEYREIISKEELLKKVYDAKKVYETGKDLIYSDLGYILLGELIEKVYEKPLDIVAKTEIFDKLEMKNTTYNPKNKEKCAPTEITQDRGLVHGVVHDEKCFSMNGVAGHAGVFSNVYDLLKFVKMILNDGKYNNQVFLSKEMIDLWFQNLVFDKNNNWTRSFSFITGKNDILITEGEEVISFNGFTGPSISIDRKNNIGIVLLTNRVHPTRDNRKINKERPIISNKIYEIIKVKQGGNHEFHI